MLIRPARDEDTAAIWSILEPTLRAGEAIALPRDISRAEAIAFWTGPGREPFVAEEAGAVLGTSFLKANQEGGGSHVANAGFVTAPHATGRGVARRLAEHALQLARDRGFQAMQFNFVITTNDRAVRLWHSLGFETVGRLPGAFQHPQHGYVDVLVLYRSL